VKNQMTARRIRRRQIDLAASGPIWATRIKWGRPIWAAADRCEQQQIDSKHAAVAAGSWVAANQFRGQQIDAVANQACGGGGRKLRQ